MADYKKQYRHSITHVEQLPATSSVITTTTNHQLVGNRVVYGIMMLIINWLHHQAWINRTRHPLSVNLAG